MQHTSNRYSVPIYNWHVGVTALQEMFGLDEEKASEIMLDIDNYRKEKISEKIEKTLDNIYNK